MALARRHVALAIALLLTGGALAGCGLPTTSTSSSSSSSSPSPSSSPSSSPSPREQNTDAALNAAWLHKGRTIGLVTSGGSTCIASGGEATLEVDGSLAVTLIRRDAGTACARDLERRVVVVGVPEGVNPSENLAITVTDDEYSGSVELDGVDGLTGWVPISEESVADGEPSAGWTQTEGQFVLLTFGSSSCVPVITDVAASGPAEVTVTFETPPGDRLCLTDRASRATVVFVEGLEADSGVTLILTGSPEFDNVSIPIYGEN